MILATVLADLFHNPIRRGFFTLASFVPLIVGTALAIVFPVSKNRVSSSYVLVSLGASALLFAALDWLVRQWRLCIPLLSTWGKNPLVLYVLHLLLIGIFFLPGIPAWYTAAPLWLVLLEAVFLLGTLSAIALWMERKHVIISL